jgi:hypothetical protein
MKDLNPGLEFSSENKIAANTGTEPQLVLQANPLQSG